MTISIENKEGSGMALLEVVGTTGMVPFCFPQEKVALDPETRKDLVRVPVVESAEGRSLVSTEGAREIIPLQEAVGKNLDAYTIESFPEGQGGRVNGVELKPGIPVEDQGIFFTGR